jgi:WD40 repeat protein
LLLAAGRDGLLFHLPTARLIGQLADASGSAGHDGDICSLVWDGNSINNYQRPGSASEIKRHTGCLIGRKSGELSSWDLKMIFSNFAGPSSSEQPPMVLDSPVRRFQAHQAPLTRIVVDAFKITTAGEDGYIRVWDALSLECLKALSTRFFRHQDATVGRRNQQQPQQTLVDVRWHPVFVYSTLTRVYLAVNNHVKVWNFDPENRLSMFSSMQSSSAAGKKRKSMKARRSRGFSFGSPKSQCKRECQIK